MSIISVALKLCPPSYFFILSLLFVPPPSRALLQGRQRSDSVRHIFPTSFKRLLLSTIFKSLLLPISFKSLLFPPVLKAFFFPPVLKASFPHQFFSFKKIHAFTNAFIPSFLCRKFFVSLICFFVPLTKRLSLTFNFSR